MNSCLEKHVSAGKIGPDEASRAYFKTVAVSDETLAVIDAHYTAQKPIVPVESIAANSQDTSKPKIPALSKDAEEMIKSMGWDKSVMWSDAK